jgi:pyrimidine oxygenase
MNNGWLVSTAGPQYLAGAELGQGMARAAERLGFDFILMPVKYRGFGGETKFWDQSVEPLTLTAAMAAVTDRITFYGSVAVLTIHPAVAARIAVTLDSIAPGRIGINIVSGWQAAEYAQMGLWPGPHYFKERYDYATEYVKVLRELWRDGVSNFAGDFFQLDDCRLSPQPLHGDMPIVCAGTSDRGMQFCADYGDFQFLTPSGTNISTAHAEQCARLLAASERSSREVGALALYLVIADETEQAARAKWERYREGVDVVAARNILGQASPDAAATAAAGTATLLKEGTVSAGLAVLFGSYEQIAEMLDEAAAVPGTSGLMLAFDDPVAGLEAFGARVLPLLRTRV